MHESEPLRTLAPGGRRVIEIAAVLGDTVLSVHHLEAGRGLGLSRATRSLIVAALIGSVVFVAAAWWAGGIVSGNRRAEASAFAAGRSLLDLRQRPVPPALDLVAGLALAVSLTAAAWALARAPRERRPRRYRVGRVAGVDLASDDLPADTPFADVVTFVGDGFVFVPAPGMTGVVIPAGAGAEEPLGKLALACGVRVRATLGAVTLHVSEVGRPSAPGGGVRLDRDVAISGAASALAHALVIAILLLVPATARGLSDDNLDATLRVASASFRPREPRIEPRVETPQTATATATATATTTRPVGDESLRPSQPQPSHPPHPAQGSARTDRSSSAPLAPRGAGILALLRGHPLDGGALSDGFDGLPDGGGGLAQNIGDPGFGPGGDPSGPGGDPSGPGGDGHLIPSGPTSPSPYGVGPTGPIHALLPPRRPHPPVVDMRPPVTGPHVDKELIRRAVRAHLAELTHCYERELSARPELAGTVNAELLIGADGHVTYARAAGLSPEVDACVAGVLQTIRFPDGEIVHVTSYPFTFRPSGS